jgi:hypothetical protein
VGQLQQKGRAVEDRTQGVHTGRLEGSRGAERDNRHASRRSSEDVAKSELWLSMECLTLSKVTCKSPSFKLCSSNLLRRTAPTCSFECVAQQHIEKSVGACPSVIYIVRLQEARRFLQEECRARPSTCWFLSQPPSLQPTTKKKHYPLCNPLWPPTMLRCYLSKYPNLRLELSMRWSSKQTTLLS